ncbi:MAG: hypothetical protein PGMFKBFP_00146 [Anaerolineales bacterium]|nr:hypothetical protein [Anaerolineales bacterium]
MGRLGFDRPHVFAGAARPARLFRQSAPAVGIFLRRHHFPVRDEPARLAGLRAPHALARRRDFMVVAPPDVAASGRLRVLGGGLRAGISRFQPAFHRRRVQSLLDGAGDVLRLAGTFPAGAARRTRARGRDPRRVDSLRAATFFHRIFLRPRTAAPDPVLAGARRRGKRAASPLETRRARLSSIRTDTCRVRRLARILLRVAALPGHLAGLGARVPAAANLGRRLERLGRGVARRVPPASLRRNGDAAHARLLAHPARGLRAFHGLSQSLAIGFRR